MSDWAKERALRLGDEIGEGNPNTRSDRAQAAITTALREAERRGKQAILDRLKEPDEKMVNYVLRYGGRCRECADSATRKLVCPHNGLPCGEGEEAVKHVLEAVVYGLTHGFIALAATLEDE